jgi:hypothetical protein
MELNVLCWGIFFACVVVPLSVFYYSHHKFTSLPSIDFVYYYGDGRLVNEYPPERLYDPDLQRKVFNEIYPLRSGFWSISPYPPLVGRVFSFYAQLPVYPAYCMWFLTSLLLYVSGIAAVLQATFPRDKLKKSLVLCLALAFPPFLWSTLVAGQLASVAVFSVGWAIYLERQSRYFWSGVVLSVLSYKPTLLLLIVPMLLLSRRFRELWGFLAGVAALIAVATRLSGVKIWAAYARMVTFWMHGAGVRGKAIYVQYTLVDLNSLRHVLFGDGARFGLIVMALIMAAIAAWLIPLLWKSGRDHGASPCLAWAVTLTWTLLLNLYVPIYDAVLVVPAIILTLAEFFKSGKRPVAWVTFAGLSIFIVSFFTQAVARRYGVQLLTIVLFVTGILETVLLHSAAVQSTNRSSTNSTA